MLSRFQLPYVTTTQRTAMTPSARDILFDTDLGKIYVGDGTTVGGNELGTAGADGEPGAPGLGIVWHGAYDNAHAYIVNDAVSSAGSAYICILGTTGNGSPASDSTHWDILAAKGSDGAGAGDVVGPSSSIDNGIVLFDSTTGKLIKDSGTVLTDKQDALGFTPENTDNRGVANGYATLDANTRVVEPPAYHNHQAGLDGDPVITEGTGTFTLPETTAWFYEDAEMEIVGFHTIAASGTLTPSDEPTHNYVCADRDTDTWVILTALPSLTDIRYIPALIAIKRAGSNSLHFQRIDYQAHGDMEAMYQCAMSTSKYSIETGALVGLACADTTLAITSSGGGVWVAERHRYDLPVTSTSTRQFQYEWNGSAWVVNPSSHTSPVANNTQYQGASGFTTLTALHWTINYIYKGVEDQDHIYSVLGTDEYTTLELAQASKTLGSLPEMITDHAVLIGRIIIQKDATTAITVESAFDTVFQASSSITDHGSLTGLADDDHTQYHNDTRGDARYQPLMGADDNYVTDAEKTIISNTSGANSGDNATNSQYSGLAASKVTANGAISGATKTKITYDAKGLVTSGADATQDDFADGTTNKAYTATEKTKLAGIEAGAEVNNISDANATDLTDGGATTLHTHAGGSGDVIGDDTSTTAQNVVAYTDTGGKHVTELTGTQGDILYHNGTNWAKLGYGTANYYLKTQGVGANPAWAAVSASSAGVLDDMQVSILQADGTLNAASGVQTWAGTNGTAQDVFTVDANSTYRFEGQYYINTGATTHTTALAFALTTATVASFEYLVLMWSAVANTLTTTQTTIHITGVASKVINATSTAVYTIIQFQGTFVTGTGGTITPQINFSANPTGTNLMKRGSYVSISKLGADTFVKSGGWA